MTLSMFRLAPTAAILTSALLLSACTSDGLAGPDEGGGDGGSANAGNLDNAFGSAGVVYAQAAGSHDRILASKPSGNGRLLSVVASNRQVALIQQLDDGRLAPDFGTQGRLTLPTGQLAQAEQAIWQDDGRLVLVGRSSAGKPMALRLTADGQTDTTFNRTGSVEFDFAGSLTCVVSLNNRLLLGGLRDDGQNRRVAMVARLAQDGTPDAGFGVARLDPGGNVEKVLLTPVARNSDLVVVALASQDSRARVRLLRLDGVGRLDGTFGDNGMVEIEAESAEQGVSLGAMALQGNTLLLVSGGPGPNRIGSAWLQRLDINGRRDANFGDNGLRRFRYETGNPFDASIGSHFADALQVLDNGRVMVAGRLGSDAIAGSGYRTRLARFYADGGSDGGFALRTDRLDWERESVGDNAPISLTALGSDRILLSGSHRYGFANARLTGDGQFDAAWGKQGRTTLTLSPSTQGGWNALTQDDSLRLAVGGAVRFGPDGGAQAVLARYDGDGKPLLAPQTLRVGQTVAGSASAVSVLLNYDDQLWSAGSLLAPSGSGGWHNRLHADGRTLALQNGVATPAAGTPFEDPHNTVILAGRYQNGFDPGFRLWRVGVDGGLDRDFGNGGYSAALPGNAADDANAQAVKRLPDGRLVAAGWIGSRLTVARYLADGSLDASFGRQGVASFEQAAQQGRARALALQLDGKVVVAGEWSDLTQSRLALLRLDERGQPDPGFGEAGWVKTSLGERGEALNGVAIQSNGKILVAGYAQTSTNGRDMLAARFEADGKPDASFGGNGRRILPLSKGDDEARALLLGRDNRFYLAGSTADPRGPLALVRMWY